MSKHICGCAKKYEEFVDRNSCGVHVLWICGSGRMRIRLNDAPDTVRVRS